MALCSVGLVAALIGATLAGWLGISQWGFYENARIDQELRAHTESDGELIGFVYRIPSPALDAHAEIGHLILADDAIEIKTETQTLKIQKSEVMAISREPNIHSLLGLGGWIVLTLKTSEALKLESRKYNTMLRSRIHSKKLCEELRTWKNERAPA